MSQRGSFITEFIYCEQCANVLRAAFQDDEVFAATNPARNGRIVGGFVKDLKPNGEVDMFQFDIAGRLRGLCHPVRIVVVPEDHQPATLVMMPGGGCEVWQPEPPEDIARLVKGGVS